MREILPEWLANLEDDEVDFIKRFLLVSGSLKHVATIYNVTYPTVRLRLDKIIHKVMLNDNIDNEPYVTMIKKLFMDERIDLGTTRLLISEYKKHSKTK